MIPRLTEKEKDVLRTATLRETITFMAKKYHLPIQVDLVVELIESKVLSNCSLSDGSVNIGGNFIKNQMFCAAVSGLILVGIMWFAAGGASFAEEQLQKYEICTRAEKPSLVQGTMQNFVNLFVPVQLPSQCALKREKANQMRRLMAEIMSQIHKNNWHRNIGALRTLLAIVWRKCRNPTVNVFQAAACPNPYAAAAPAPKASHQPERMSSSKNEEWKSANSSSKSKTAEMTSAKSQPITDTEKTKAKAEAKSIVRRTSTRKTIAKKLGS